MKPAPATRQRSVLLLLLFFLGSLIDSLNSYLMVSSVVGFYSLRVFEGLTPRNDDTTMTTVRTGVKWGLRLLLQCGVWDPLCFVHSPPSLPSPPTTLSRLPLTLNSYCSLTFSSGPLNGFS